MHTIEREIRNCRRHKAQACLDTSSEALRQEIEATPYLFKPNEQELSVFVGGNYKSIKEYAAAAVEVLGRHKRQSFI